MPPDRKGSIQTGNTYIEQSYNILKHYETYISTQEYKTEARSRISKADEHQSRPPHPQTPPQAGPEAPFCLKTGR
jgi:hypothetical protein